MALLLVNMHRPQHWWIHGGGGNPTMAPAGKESCMGWWALGSLFIVHVMLIYNGLLYQTHLQESKWPKMR